MTHFFTILGIKVDFGSEIIPPVKCSYTASFFSDADVFSCNLVFDILGEHVAKVLVGTKENVLKDFAFNTRLLRPHHKHILEFKSDDIEQTNLKISEFLVAAITGQTN